jgi:type IX secretion system PorP/SprF family membrane protein
MRLRNIIILFLLQLSFFYGKAQDVHFSQFYAAPYHINPALTGNFDGDYRFIGNQRTQWRSVTLPYQTFAVSGEMRNVINKKHLNTGISIMNDKTGDSRFNTFRIGLSGSYDLKFDEKNSFTLGLQPAMVQRSMDISKLTFDNQFQGDRFSSANPTAENLSRGAFFYLDFAGGFIYNRVVNEKVKFSTGMAVYNINRPGQSFMNDVVVNLDPRLTFYGGGDVVLDDYWSLQPSFIWMKQGTFKEVLIGSGATYKVDRKGSKVRSFSFGNWFRFGDAGFVMAGMDYEGVNFALSYDFNYSSLVPASQYRGGFELSIIYIIKNFEPARPAHRICPSFI